MVTSPSENAPPQHTPDLSIIIATVEAARNIDRCLTSVTAATAGMEAETWVLDASRDETASLAARHVGSARVIRYAADTTTLVLWARGIERARGRVVALTTGHFTVEASWARAMLAGIHDDIAGAAGAIALDRDASLVDEAVFYLRYAAYLHPRHAPDHAVEMIPADNAAYDASTLAQHREAYRAGFSEVSFHRRLFAEGKRLAVVDGATATFGRSFPLAVILAHRLAHGREFGAWRVTNEKTSAARIVLAAPIVPFALAVRAARNALPLRGHRFRFLRSLPLFLLLAAAWASGEALGAVRGQRARREGTADA